MTTNANIMVLRGLACVVCDRCGGSGLIVITNDGDELPYRSCAADLVHTGPEECLPCPDCIAANVESYRPSPNP